MLHATIANLLDPRYRQTAERYEGFQAGGGGKVRRAEVVLDGASLDRDGAALRATFEHDGGRIDATARALALPADWLGYAQAVLDVANGDTPVSLQLAVIGARGRLIARRELAAGETARVAVDLVDLPLAQGIRPAYEPTGLRLTCQWGDTWRTEGERLMAGGTWPRTQHNAPVSVLIRAIALEPAAEARPRPVVDAFGQRIHADWPTKVAGDAHMRQVIAEENAWLARTPPHADRDRFGGWTAGPRFEAGGFFRVERTADGRWWYADPDGNPFWSIGTTGVRSTDCTAITGREFLFESLPDRAGPYAAAYNPPVVSPANDGRGADTIAFYRLNVLRKWGSLERWRDRVVQRFAAWGFNTLGNWSEEIMLAQRGVPHTRALSSRFEDTAAVARRMPDVWDEAWRRRFEAETARAAGAHRENPWLLGYFCDNEMPWGGLYRNVLDCPPDAAARGALARFLAARYAGVESFNRDSGLSLARWDDLRGVKPDDLPGDDDGPWAAAMHAFAGVYAERYFEIVAATIRRHDPNHLYLGCRFVRRRPHDLISAAAGRHCDAVTVNMYDLWPRREEFGAWYEACRRPIQIGEHHTPLFTPRQVPPLYPAFTDEERRVLYYELVMKWADQPYSLGCHWYQHADQHITGRPNDGENQPVGFVDIADRPYPEMVEAAREATARMYRWHAEGMGACEHPEWIRAARERQAGRETGA